MIVYLYKQRVRNIGGCRLVFSVCKPTSFIPDDISWSACINGKVLNSESYRLL